MDHQKLVGKIFSHPSNKEVLVNLFVIVFSVAPKMV